MLIIPRTIDAPATWELTSKYDLNVGKHRMNALVGYSYQYYTYERFYANNYNFPTDFYQWHNLGLGQALRRR